MAFTLSRCRFFSHSVSQARMPLIEAVSPFLIVGLGNYTNPLTRHSVGQVAVDALAARLGLSLTYDRSTLSWNAQTQLDIPLPRPKNARRKPLAQTQPETSPNDSTAEPDILRVNITLMKPKLFMNLSGKAVSLSLRSISKRPSSRSIIAIHDSLDHAPMTIRPKASGSAEGHNGVKSIIASLGGNMNFARLRLGIGRPEGGKIPIDQYVLGTMSQPELKFWGEGGVGVDKVWEALVGIMVEEAKAQQQ